MQKLNFIQYLLILSILFSTGCLDQGENDIHTDHNFDFDWYFHLGEIDSFDFSVVKHQDWRKLDLPHDWSIEGEYGLNHGTDWQTGFLPTGVGWYYKEFNWKKEWKGKKVSIYFEGIYLNSDVWINGHHLGSRPNGYLSFEYDLTPHLNRNSNVIAVRVDHSKPLTGRWYTGSGIYRHVWIKTDNPVHIPLWGLHFTTPRVSKERADYKVGVEVKNTTDKPEILQLRSVLNFNGELIDEISREIEMPSDTTIHINLESEILNPALWSPDKPDLYDLNVYLMKGTNILDRQELSAGFRWLEYSPDYGCKLNGENILFRGVCDHHTAGAVGAAVPDDVLRYRLGLLKEMGCNAIRTAHNPFSPRFYELCDELGIMVLNEFLDGWEKEKAKHDYGLYFEEWWKRDAIDFIKRDRNHPSIVMWSIGNEVQSPTLETQKKLIDLFHSYDPTRPVTQGGKSPSRDEGTPDLQSQLDIAGYNGHGEEKGVFERHHSDFPDDVILGTEIPHTYQTRGVYRTKTHWRVRDFPAMWEIAGRRAGKLGNMMERVYPVEDLTAEEVFTEEVCSTYYKNGDYYPIDNPSDWAGTLYYQSSYDNAIVRANARKTWQRVKKLPYVIGQFRWGSFDYLGETNNWPSRCANFGVIDVAGIPKDHFHLYRSLWTEDPMVHILPHWTHPGKEGVKIPVVIYTNCDKVELLLNGNSLGTKEYQGEQLVWMVPYEAGTLKAKAYVDGQLVAEKSQTTSGNPSKINFVPDKTSIKANRTDVVHVMVEIVDENNIHCPDANLPLNFQLKGPGKILGVDNGDPIDLSDYKSNTRRTFHGKAMILIQAGNESGTIVLEAASPDLESSALEIISEN